MTATTSTTITTLAGGAAADFLTVHHVRAEGTNRAIGRTLAEAARRIHGTAAGPLPSADPLIRHVRLEWFAERYPALVERMAGVADTFGVDPDDERYELAWLGTFGLPAGCSVVHYPGSGTKDGHGIVSRHFDFPTATFGEIVGFGRLAEEAPLAAHVWVTELHPVDGYASIALGIMDVLGAMDGVNEAGLSVALLADNETPEPEPSGGPQVGLSEQQVVRYLLDTCATAAEARRALLLAKQYYFFTPCHFLVADRSGDSFVWEHSPRRNLERMVEAPSGSGGRLICTNHLLHRWPEGTELPDDSGPIGTAAFTYGRWRTLAEEVHGGGVVSREDIRDQFAAVRFAAPLEGGRTFWHALYDVDEPSAEVAFYLHDVAGESVYSDPVRLTL